MQEVRTTYRCSTFPQTAKQHSASTIPNTPDSNKTQNQTVLKKKVHEVILIAKKKIEPRYRRKL